MISCQTCWWAAVFVDVSGCGPVRSDPTECKAHYMQYYLSEPHPALPRESAITPGWSGQSVMFVPPGLPLPLTPERTCAHPVQLLPPSGRDPEPPYYPGTEIDGYMPHRGDFAVVSVDKASSQCTSVPMGLVILCGRRQMTMLRRT